MLIVLSSLNYLLNKLNTLLTVRSIRRVKNNVINKLVNNIGNGKCYIFDAIFNKKINADLRGECWDWVTEYNNLQSYIFKFPCKCYCHSQPYVTVCFLSEILVTVFLYKPWRNTKANFVKYFYLHFYNALTNKKNTNMDINYKIFRKQTSISARPVEESYPADS